MSGVYMWGAIGIKYTHTGCQLISGTYIWGVIYARYLHIGCHVHA